MEVGEYVRTKNGEIGKLVNVEVYYVLGQDDKDKYSCVLFNNSYVPCIVLNDFIVKKGQPIDLIEVGDLIKHRINNVIFISEVDERRFTKEQQLCIEFAGKVINIKDLNIISIVTKEQFSQMEYKIGEWFYGIMD